MLKILVKLYADHEPEPPGELADIYYHLARLRAEGIATRRATLDTAPDAADADA